MPMTEDLQVFFVEAEFATAAVLDGRPVMGILDEPRSEALGIPSTDPTYKLPTADVPAAYAGINLQVGDRFSGRQYKVRHHDPDGTGISVLTLEHTPT